MKLPVVKLLMSSVMLGAVLLCSMRYQAQTAATALADALDTYAQQYKHFSGTILITQCGTVLFKKAYGCANYEFEVPNDCATRFPIASNTKLCTAVAIMLLQERGLLSVQDAVDMYVPGFSKSITIHHLLTHTSGIPNYYTHWDAMCRCNDLAAMVGSIKIWSLEFEPGSRYCYSNTGYLILAYVIEKVSGVMYEAFLQDAIFKPLNMHNTGSICSGKVIPQKASGYITKNGMLYNAPAVVHFLTLLGNGDLYSTADDMHTFMHALFSGSIINQKSLDCLLSRHVMMEGSSERAHGYGCFVDIRNGKQIVEYSGALVGFLSKIVHIVDDSISITILTNREDMDEFTHVCDGLFDVVMNG